MPEFKEDKEELDSPTDCEIAAIKEEETSKNKMIENDDVRFSLKRGRIPAQKKDIAAATAANIDAIEATDVQNDAIGISFDKISKSNVKKSTNVVEREKSPKSKKNPKCNGQRSDLKDECKKDPCCSFRKNDYNCKCGVLRKYLNKFLGFLGLCKKNQKTEKIARPYRHRSHNQRRRRS